MAATTMAAGAMAADEMAAGAMAANEMATGAMAAAATPATIADEPAIRISSNQSFFPPSCSLLILFDKVKVIL
jgi:hypothetical protein